jgi:hypothetical protein
MTQMNTPTPSCFTLLRTECDQLRADCDNETKWAAHYLAQSIADKARADKAEAELATERAQLDHVLKIDCAWNDRSEIDQDIKNMSGESKK